jgi:hypothetical protein
MEKEGIRYPLKRLNLKDKKIKPFEAKGLI